MIRWLRRHAWAVLLAALAAALLLGYGVLPTSRALAVARPPRKIGQQTPRDVGLIAQTVAMTTTAGETVRGWYVPPRNGAVVVLSHGYGSNKADELAPAQWLAEAGYGVLLIDLVGQGESGGDRLAVDGRDVLAAVDYLRRRGDVPDGHIFLWGFSLGGLVSLQAAARSDAVGAVVADGPFPVLTGADMPAPASPTEWLWLPFDTVQRLALRLRGVAPAMSTLAALQRIRPRPVLLVAGTRNAGERRVLRHYAAAAGDTATLWEVPEAGHTEALGLRRAEYLRRVFALFEQAR